LDILQSIPVLGFLPGLVLGLIAIFPHSNTGLELAAIIMIFTGQVWNMVFAYYASLKSIPRDYAEVSQLIGLTPLQRLFKLELPFASLNLTWASLMSMSGGWFFLSICESFTLGAQQFRLPGVGAYMAVAIAEGDIKAMVAGIVAMAFIIVILDFVLWRPILNWVHRFRTEDIASDQPDVPFMEVYQLETGKTLGAQTGTTPAPAAPAEDTSPREVSLDDDPVIGDKNAPVTIVEFSDYECPFCKRHFTDTYPQIKKEYIDTGKVKLVFRDLPLSFHDPMATKEAMAADCVRDQGGDDAYFKMHDLMYTNTTSNGTGLTEDQIYQYAGEAGANADEVKQCVESGKFKDEIAKDIADGAKVGATATPTFFIGKTDGNKIMGTPLIGAYPYQNFKDLIDKNLK
jgi:protein-disulfide isomerase/ABC-type proline/glycine betaine transport system permease subunit